MTASFGLRDIFERPFDGEDDPRIRVAQAITRAEAEAILEHRGDLILALSAPSPVVEGQGSSVAESGGTALPKSDGQHSAGWRPISTAPKDGTHIILAFGQDGVMEGWWDDHDPGPYPWKFLDRGAPGSTGYAAGGFINGSREVRGGPTHWQPLPSPPAKLNASSPTEGRAGNLAGDEPPSSSPPQATNSEVERNTQKLSARDLTDAELMTELTRVEKLWDEMFAPDEDGEEFEGHGGSPGEWMVERMNEIETEISRRAALDQGVGE